VHGTGVYSAGVGPKGPALERFLDIKKKKSYHDFLALFCPFSWVFFHVYFMCI
jgi:hypothetical protein